MEVCNILLRGVKMLVEKHINGFNQRNHIEFKNISQEIIPWLEETALENNCLIDKKEWKSKYNSYVVYDYEPFCSDGFEINVVISSVSINNVDFIKYLYEKKRKQIDYLRKCAEI